MKLCARARSHLPPFDALQCSTLCAGSLPLDICGEETALMESLNGKRGRPHLKPPFAAYISLLGCPTTVANVETISLATILCRYHAPRFLGLRRAQNARPQGQHALMSDRRSSSIHARPNCQADPPLAISPAVHPRLPSPPLPECPCSYVSLCSSSASRSRSQWSSSTFCTGAQNGTQLRGSPSCQKWS